MTILLGFLLPIIFFLTLWLVFRAKNDPHWPLVAGLGVAAVSSTALLLTVFTSALWTAGPNIAWIGASAIDQDHALVLGGNPATAVTGWPNRAFSPRVEISPLPAGMASVQVSGAGGFVRVGSEWISGTLLVSGLPTEAGAYSVRQKRGWFWHHIDLLPSDGGKPLRFRVSKAGRDRVVALSTLVHATVLRMRGTSEQEAQVAETLDRWASAKLLLFTREGTVRLVTEDSTCRSSMPVPTTFQIRWRNRDLRCSIERTASGALHVRFLPPWRLVSPMPPSDKGTPGVVTLALEREARPGDKAFLLPLGGAVEDPHLEAALEVDQSGMPRFRANPALRPVREPHRPAAESFTSRDIATAASQAGVGSAVDMPLKKVGLRIAVVDDHPQAGRLITCLVLALALLAFGLLLVLLDLRPPDSWAVAGVVSVAWCFLLLRLLLALRYALEPGRLDRLAVSGLTMALIGLTMLPGLVLFVALLYRSQYWTFKDYRARRRSALLCFGYLIALYLAGLTTRVLAASMWPNVPPEYHFTLGVVGSAILAASFFFLAVVLVVKFTRAATAGIAPSALGAWSRPLAEFLQVFKRLATSRAPRFWWTVGTTDEQQVQSIVGKLPPEGRRANFFWVFGPLLALELLALVAVLISSFIFATTAIEEVVAPFFLCWAPAVIWLGSRLCFLPGETIRTFHYGRLAAVSFLVVVPLFGLPLAMRDPGGLIASAAIFIPLTLLLALAKPLRPAAFALASLIVGVALAVAVLANPRPLLKFLPGEMGPRTLALEQWPQLERSLLFHASLREVDPSGTPVWTLKYAIQHAWESKAIAHEGGIFGLGYGEAPAQRSQVRQDTLQSDSVFTFFVVSEYGLVGGAALLLLSLLPLVIVVIGAWERFDIGHGVAVLVTGAFFLEGAYHAAMNLGALPITGRNYPLLSVNSPSDLVRWGLLFALAVQALLWRSTGEEDGYDVAAASIISPQDPRVACTDPRPERVGAFARASLVLLVPALTCAVVIIAVGLRNANDTLMDKPFSWQGILDTIKELVAEGQLAVVDQETGRIKLDERLSTGGKSLLEEEVNRFNALPAKERLGGTSVANQLFADRASSVGSLAQYDDLLADLHEASASEVGRREPPLFVIERENDTETGESRLMLEPNAAFNSTLSFKSGRNPQQMPLIAFATNDRGPADPPIRGALVGPAWVMGRWVEVQDPEGLVPWAEHLETAASAEWARLGPRQAESRYGHLSLTRPLHVAAQEFVRRKGRQLHGQLLAKGGTENALPPRVGLTVIEIPSGQVLALGGWPRMNPTSAWVTARDGENVPSRDWVENIAPGSIARRYEGDRNFDLLLMGSATKPIFAAAVLATHPGIDARFCVRGPRNDDEDSVFGIPVTPGWHVGPSQSLAGGEWCDFDSFLARSDNRYAVELGFLGLAAKEQDRPGWIATEPGMRVGSTPESMDRGMSCWHAYPSFPQSLGFGLHQPGRLRALQDTPLAAHLHDMFGVEVAQKKGLRFLVSCWTGNERDDRPPALADPAHGQSGGEPRERAADTNPASAPGLKFFNVISPVGANLELDTVTTPRAWVSVLLGGRSNRWSAVEFGAAFATCILGRPVLPSLIERTTPVQPAASRVGFVETARHLRRALTAVVRANGGTAHDFLRNAGGLAVIDRLKGVSVYAKTGTLAEERGQHPSTSRIVLALVRWQDRAQTVASHGLVFSLVAERAQMGMATTWLGEFLTENEPRIREFLGEK